MNLHIFEHRYRQLIKECEEEDIEFGIPYYQKDRPLKFGTMVKLLEVSKHYPDGRMDIKTIGVKPFEVKRYRSEFPKKPYPGGYIVLTYWEKEGNKDVYKSILEKVQELYDIMKISKLPNEFKKDFTTFDIAHKVGFSKSQEYDLLQISTELERQDFMLQHLTNLVPMVRQMEEMRKKVEMNGHFKHLKPPL